MDSEAHKGKEASTDAQRLRYFRAGGFNQLQLETAGDLRALRKLDQTLWVASSCPTHGLDMDERTLSLMDYDQDGRIRVPEILSAIDWVLRVLKEPDTLPEGRDWLELTQLDQENPAGAAIYESAKRILRNLGRHDADRITLTDALAREEIFAVAKCNGDGVIPRSAAEGEQVALVIDDVLTTVGGATDLSGKEGVTADGVERFFTALQAYYSWWCRAHPAAQALLDTTATAAELPEQDAAIFPLGEQTAAAWSALDAVRGAVEAYFENCEVAAFDAQAVSFLNFSDRDLSKLTGRGKEELDAMLKALPLAKVSAEASLPLTAGINPYYAPALANLKRHAVEPLLGTGVEWLTPASWRELCDKLASYEVWIGAKAGAEVEKLGLERIVECLRQDLHGALDALISLDKAIAAEIKAVDEVERVLRYHRDLFRLLKNYVALPEFYDMQRRAIFQLGQLIIDGCALQLCVDVEDMNKHALIAAKSGIFLVYCEIQRMDMPKKRTIAAAVTQRSVGRITVGKNAVFYDRYGKDWDARVIKVVSNPISLHEAALAPFRKIGELIGSQIEKLTSSRQKAIEASLNTTFQNVDKKIASGPQKAPEPAQDKSGPGIGGMLAGGGVALAALSSSFAFIATTLQKIHDVYFLYTALVVLLFILLPAVIIGFFKLRSRDIGMVLEACGWAINGKMRINLKLARQLTEVGKFPLTAERTFPAYAQKRGGVLRILLSVLLGALLAWGAVSAARVIWAKEAQSLEQETEQSTEAVTATEPAPEN